jgi:putative colanic acid biosynthesis glycosyltransferase
MQSYQSYEWIIIDAVSNDGTKEFINSINDIKFKFVSEKDKGIYDGMNKGIKFATRQYIFFLNAGDILNDTSVLALITSIVKNKEYDIIYGGVRMKIGKNFYIRSPKKNIDSVLYTLPGHHQATIYRKSLLDMFNYDLKYEFSGDYYISAILYINGYRNFYFTEHLVCEFEVGHHSYKNLFKIWYFSNDIQKNILQISFINRFLSSFKRLTSSIFLVVYFQFSKYIKL